MLARSRWAGTGLCDVCCGICSCFVSVTSHSLHCTICNPIQDKLMTHPCEPWFSSLVFIEVLFQLPFFCLAVYALLNNGKSRNSNNTLIKGDGIFRSLCMIYGSSTATTLVPIFASLLTDTTTLAEKGVLMGWVHNIWNLKLSEMSLHLHSLIILFSPKILHAIFHIPGMAGGDCCLWRQCVW